MDTGVLNSLRRLILLVLVLLLPACSAVKPRSRTSSGVAEPGTNNSSNLSGPLESNSLKSQQQSPAPQKTSRPAPTAGDKGAEKLIFSKASSTPPLTASSHPVTNPPSARVNPAQTVSSTAEIAAGQQEPVTGMKTVPRPAAGELLVTGPPLPAQPGPARDRRGLWFGLCLFGVIAALSGWLYFQRRTATAVAEQNKEELVTPPGFVLRKPRTPPARSDVSSGK